MEFIQLDDFRWELPATGGMRVPGRIYASNELIGKIKADRAPEQVANVAHLPGIVGFSLAMPDIHWGYGFPIGGVAAFDLDNGVVSPGGVGYDINCGVRLMTTKLERRQVSQRMTDLVHRLFRAIPCGVGASSDLKLRKSEEDSVLVCGAQWAIDNGYGVPRDAERIEEGGCIPGADPAMLSSRARQRGKSQLGTLGSGNHFIEIGYVDRVLNDDAARAMSLSPGTVTISIHSGSRGLGYQVCDDSLGDMVKAAAKYGIHLPDRQLCCAPIQSQEGQAYLAAMFAAVNYAFANRQMLAHRVRTVFGEMFGERSAAVSTVYEVAHNIAKIENHVVNGVARRLCVHRKGATRAFGPGRPEISAPYRALGQPVLVPGDMGRCSYVLIGTQKAMEETFGSACHGAGRMLSRKQAVRQAKGRSITRELEDRGVMVMAAGRRTLQEEMPEAYKDVSQVVNSAVGAGLCQTVARLRPMGCLKG